MSVLDKIYAEVLLIVRSGADLDHMCYLIDQREWFVLEDEMKTMRRYPKETWLPLTKIFIYGIEVRRR